MLERLMRASAWGSLLRHGVLRLDSWNAAAAGGAHALPEPPSSQSCARRYTRAGFVRKTGVEAPLETQAQAERRSTPAGSLRSEPKYRRSPRASALSS